MKVESKWLLLIFVLPWLGGCKPVDEKSYTCQAAPEVFYHEAAPGTANVAIELKLNTGIFSAPPSFALWAELPDGNSQTIYATCKAASGNWGGGAQSDGLPVWDAIRVEEGLGYDPADLDAITSATPTRPNFLLHYELPAAYLGDTVAIVLEFNLSGDYNQYYTRDFGDNGQPSILWRTDFIFDGSEVNVTRASRVVGRSHATGADHKIYSDLVGITTAKELVTGLLVKKI